MVEAALACVLYLAGLAVAFGLRTLRQRRATGDTGLRRPAGARPSEPRWWGQVLFVLAVLGGLASPLAALTGVVPAPRVPVVVSVPAVVVTLAGFALVVVSQTAMGRSWRIGVDPAERTALVTGGVFARVRNPIFTGLVVAVTGLVALVPSWPGVLALVLLVVAVQIQVRAVEEPYLLATHGGAYRGYAARVGRFVPGLGRLPATAR